MLTGDGRSMFVCSNRADANNHYAKDNDLYQRNDGYDHKEDRDQNDETQKAQAGYNHYEGGSHVNYDRD